MSYAYNIQDARRQRLRGDLRDERRLNKDIKTLEDLRTKIYTGLLRQAMAKEIVEASDARKRVLRLLELLNVLCSQVPALQLLRGEHYGVMLYVVDLQSELELPEAERIHYELRGRPLKHSPYEEETSENEDSKDL